jgi:hypothetical protein
VGRYYGNLLYFIFSFAGEAFMKNTIKKYKRRGGGWRGD